MEEFIPIGKQERVEQISLQVGLVVGSGCKCMLVSPLPYCLHDPQPFNIPLMSRRRRVQHTITECLELLPL